MADIAISVDFRSRTPIYEQIIQSVKEAALANGLGDEQLPSIRQLTGQLGINPNTVQKAYSELERQGIIYTLAGRGVYISGDAERLGGIRRGEILKEVENSVSDAKKYSIGKDAIDDIVNKIYTDEKGESLR